jgi:hypothetical protein
MWRELYMENFEPHKREIFWYNISVLRWRSNLIFDIGLRTGRRRRHLFRSVCEASGLVHSCIGQNPGSAVLEKPPPTVETAFNRRLPLVGSRVPRDRRPVSRGNASDARSMYATAYWCFRENHYFHGRGRIRCCAAWQSCGATSFPMLRPGS